MTYFIENLKSKFFINFFSKKKGMDCGSMKMGFGGLEGLKGMLQGMMGSFGGMGGHGMQMMSGCD
jgi:hypothetical protein